MSLAIGVSHSIWTGRAEVCVDSVKWRWPQPHPSLRWLLSPTPPLLAVGLASPSCQEYPMNCRMFVSISVAVY